MTPQTAEGDLRRVNRDPLRGHTETEEGEQICDAQRERQGRGNKRCFDILIVRGSTRCFDILPIMRGDTGHSESPQQTQSEEGG